MNSLLRRLAEWKGRRRAAQIIVLDGGAEVERTRAFLRGVAVGAGLALAALLLTAPGANDPHLLAEVRQREVLLREANGRAEQAVSVANVCLHTAQSLERTLASYQAVLNGRAPAAVGMSLSGRR